MMQGGYAKLKAGLALALVCCAAGGMPAQAQQQEPIELVVPFAPGGAADTLGRLHAQELATELKTVAVVANRHGAGGSVGAAYAAKARPDGKTILLGTISTHAINPALYSNTGYDANKDFTPVARVVGLPNILVVRADSDIKTVDDLIAKSKKTELTFGSPGNGTTAHLVGELMKQMQPGMKLVHVPYRGSAAATTDLIGGRIDFQFDNIPSLLPHVQAGRLRVLAVSSTTPSEFVPGVVPLSDHPGFKGFEVLSWFGLWLPAGASQESLGSYVTALGRMYQNPAFLEKVRGVGFTPAYISGDDFKAFIASEQKKWREVVQSANIRID